MEDGKDQFKELDNAETEGKKNILRYFDRIHDKLFTINNIFIAGYFFLIKFEGTDNISVYNILIPLGNLVYLIFLEHRMMEMSRAQSNIMNIPINELQKKVFEKGNEVTLLSLGAIVFTTVVLIVFTWNLIF